MVELSMFIDRLPLRALAGLCVCSALVGCAATLPTMQSTTPVAAGALSNYAVPSAGSATVHILRDGAFSGGAVDYDVYVDDKLVGSIAVEQRMTLYLPPGEHAIMIRNPLPVALTGAPASTVQMFSADTAYFFRFSAGSGGGSTLQRVTAASVGAAAP
jgi:hypothetical protein